MKVLTRVAPIRAGVVLGNLYGITGLIMAPFIFLIPSEVDTGKFPGGLIGAAIFLVLYALTGFVGGVVLAALYNLVTKWTGGLKLEISDDVVADGY